jgi:hypothetical protein
MRFRTFSPAESYWNHRFELAQLRERILIFNEACNNPSNLTLFQYAQLAATSLEFRPDLIIELGRGAGNSTCVFTEIAGRIGARVLSFDLWNDWEEHTAPRLREHVPSDWFAPLGALRGDILAIDFNDVVGSAQRVMVFWDAHGFEVAEAVIGGLLPELVNREHLVLMHDMFDSRYLQPGNMQYNGRPLWKGENFGGARVKLGFIDAEVQQAVAIYDFAIRNEMPLHSADHDLHGVFGGSVERREEMERLMGDLFSLSGWWFYFSLAEAAAGPLTFPARGR